MIRVTREPTFLAIHQALALASSRHRVDPITATYRTQATRAENLNNRWDSRDGEESPGAAPGLTLGERAGLPDPERPESGKR